jgi:rhamnogalacturonan endolyase
MVQRLTSALTVATLLIAVLAACRHSAAQRQMEQLGRGLVALRAASGEVFVQWRLLGTDPPDIGFNLYRVTGNAEPVRVNSGPLEGPTHFIDREAEPTTHNAWFVRPVVDGRELGPSGRFVVPAGSAAKPYLSVPIAPPDGYHANDASVGDLEGDGEYEIVVHMVGEGRDNSRNGRTTEPILDAYRLDGARLWRINLGKNIREGAHYTQFMVYDLDGDGRAELACKTADGTVDGVGKVIGDPDADHRDDDGRILDGAEYLTIFDGLTGAALATTGYIPPRGDIAAWGDRYGNRSDRFLACVAYLDGRRPSLVMCRGYYTRAALAAWNWRDGQLTHVWTFDSDDGTPGNEAYRAQGNHGIGVGDVDEDGRDEIIYGSCVIDDNGTGLYSTGAGHGDAMHFTDIDPARPGLEVFKANGDGRHSAGIQLRDARSGQQIFGVPSKLSGGMARAIALDVDPRFPGLEMWGYDTPGRPRWGWWLRRRGRSERDQSERSRRDDGKESRDRVANERAQSSPIAGRPDSIGERRDRDSGATGLYDVRGNRISEAMPRSCNMGIWWDGDPLRELLDGVRITKWDCEAGSDVELVDGSAFDCESNNGSKANPCLCADILGDWREELVARTRDNRELRIFVTTIATERRLYTLMHDPIYRLAVAWQNVSYNQPAHTGFYLGHDMDDPPRPNIATLAPALARDQD